MPQDTPLHKAAYKGEVETCQELLEDQTSNPVNCRGAQNRTPLHRAVGKGHNEVVKLLIEKKADLSLVDSGGLTALHWAALFGLVDTGKILYDNGASVDAPTKSGETPLHLCAEKGTVEFVQFLLANEANQELRDNGAGGGGTAYDSAKKANQKECMALLKPAGGDGCCVVS